MNYLTIAHAAGIMGVEAFLVSVEVDIQMSQLPRWFLVGLADSEVKESRERVVSAIHNSGYDFPYRRVVINLAPADVKKEGTALDLPIALALIATGDRIKKEKLKSYLCVGELSLDGSLRPVRGALPIAVFAAEKKYKGLILPKANVNEASMVEGLQVYGVSNLSEAVEFLAGQLDIKPHQTQNFDQSQISYSYDFNEIAGQYQAKRALEIAASGAHNLIFLGSPGSGKTMLASRLPSILPPLSFEESLDTSRIYSVSSMLKNQSTLLIERPFRSPHHSISDAGLIGGGSIPKPGEVSLSHNGVLFLDELPEFKKHVLELLRQPLEAHEVTISRATVSLTYPASFMLLASMNPCLCGYQGHPKIHCTCRPQQIQNYQSRLSGPLLDRIDLQIEVPPVTFEDMDSKTEERESSAQIRERVIKIRGLQSERFKNHSINLNSQMQPRHLRDFCELNSDGKAIMKSMMNKFQLSGRSFNRILKVSRTIADMSGAQNIQTDHLLEAVQYRSLDRAGNY